VWNRVFILKVAAYLTVFTLCFLCATDLHLDAQMERPINWVFVCHRSILVRPNKDILAIWHPFTILHSKKYDELEVLKDTKYDMYIRIARLG